jgi:hypothetical protein
MGTDLAMHNGLLGRLEKLGSGEKLPKLGSMGSGAALDRSPMDKSMSVGRRTSWHGLTLVLYSAQPEPFFPLKLNNYSPKSA